MMRDVAKLVVLSIGMLGAINLAWSHEGRSATPGPAIADVRESELETPSDVPRKKCSGNHADDEAQRRPKSDFRRLYELNLTAATDHRGDQILALV